MTQQFNLIDEPWIPIIDRSGARDVGILQALVSAHELIEIDDASPLVSVALHRLLLAIMRRALKGPAGFKAWSELCKNGKFDSEVVEKYLEEWRDRFDLVSAEHPFYQVAGLSSEDTKPISELALERACGNNATLFDHSSDETAVRWSAPTAARYLVAAQSFAVGGGQCSDVTIGGKIEKRPNRTHAVAFSGMNVWTQGATLFETLMINLTLAQFDEGDKDKPPWELDRSHEYRDRWISAKKRRTVGSNGVVDNFTWQSRLVRLIPNDDSTGELTFSKIYFSQGRSLDESATDPMKVYFVPDKKEGRKTLSLRVDKAPWRDAHAIFMLRSREEKESRPECFNVIARAKDEGVFSSQKLVTVRVAGMANDKAKIFLWRSERMPVAPDVLTDEDLIEHIDFLLKEAEKVALELNQRTRKVATFYLRQDSELKPDKDAVSDLTKTIDPRPAYWARLERHFHKTLIDLPEDKEEDASNWREGGVSAEWRAHLREEAERALRESVRSLGMSARAIQAIARVPLKFGAKNQSDLKKEVA